jgi:hypothetical protein
LLFGISVIEPMIPESGNFEIWCYGVGRPGRLKVCATSCGNPARLECREDIVDAVEVEAEPAVHGGFVAEEDAEAVFSHFSFALELAGE